MTEIPSLPLPLAVYGTLRRGGGALISLEPACHYLGRGHLAGQLYDLGDYPGLLPDSDGTAGLVDVELYRLPDPTFLATVDRYEGFRLEQPGSSLFARRQVRLEKPELDAWVYFWNGSTDGLRRIESGDWIAELSQRRA